MTAAEQQEIYLLRRHMGISAREAYIETPAWELDLLLSGLHREMAAAAELDS